MKRTMMVVVVVAAVGMFARPVFAAGGSTSTDSSTDLNMELYELQVLDEVAKLEVTVYNQDYTWHCSGTADFSNDEANLTMDISAGPGNYRGYAYWEDKWGNPLFYCYDGKISTFHEGVNVKDFPMYLYWSRVLHFQIDGPSKDDEVWVNGNRAWYADGYWQASISQPWTISSLEIVWTGHGGWTVGINPSSQLDSSISLDSSTMDPTKDSAAQMAAVSYSAEDSWTNGVSSYMYNVSDGQGNTMAEFSANIAVGTSVMVFFSYWDQSLGTVEYYNTTVTVTDKLADGPVILVPLTGTWLSTSSTYVRLVYTDASGTVRQTYVYMGGLG